MTGLPSGRTVPVTVVIAARDEAANIAACIASVAWAREVILVENDSVDDTADIAFRAGAEVIRNQFVTIGGQRNAAIERASCDWVLVVDADERGSPELGGEVSSIVTNAAPGGPESYRIPRRNFFLGREVRHGGWERDAPVRLFRSTLRYSSSRVHEHVETGGATGVLRSTLLHAPYATIGQYFEKLDRYSRWWAEDRFEQGRRAGAGTVVLRPPLRFLSMYVLKRGFLDGAPGAVLACLAATSVMAKYARLWAMGHGRPT
ncbi:MAG: glycosyltransferase family 2 protein [Gemmatimonadaceae bacterium]